MPQPFGGRVPRLRRQRVLRGSSDRDVERGFTLLEIAVTLMIMAILLAIALPRLPRIGRTDLEASADRLASTMSYLSDEASLRGRIYRLTLDLDSEDWTVASLAPFAKSAGDPRRPGEPQQQAPAAFEEVADDPLARSVELPDGVSFDAVLDRDGETRTGQRPVYFLPEGLAESLDVRLRDDEGGDEVLVRLDAARGIASREIAEKRP